MVWRSTSWYLIRLSLVMKVHVFAVKGETATAEFRLVSIIGSGHPYKYRIYLLPGNIICWTVTSEVSVSFTYYYTLLTLADCSHIWSWSLIVMKLSSIYLIAPTLAAIASGATAAPRPDIYSRGLEYIAEHQYPFKEVAGLTASAAAVNVENIQQCCTIKRKRWSTTGTCAALYGICEGAGKIGACNDSYPRSPRVAIVEFVVVILNLGVICIAVINYAETLVALLFVSVPSRCHPAPLSHL